MTAVQALRTDPGASPSRVRIPDTRGGARDGGALGFGSSRYAHIDAGPSGLSATCICVIGVLWTVMQRRPDSSAEAYIEAFVSVSKSRIRESGNPVCGIGRESPFDPGGPGGDF